MEPSEGLRAAALNRFLQEYLDDCEGGAVRPIAEYEARYPQIAGSIADELARLEEGAPQEPVPGVGRDDVSGRRLGPYQLERELGRGGQGSVFLARDTRLDRRIALKLLRSHATWSAEALERFRREAALAARLDHPGLCTVFESDTVDGVPYVALQYVEGETLARRLAGGALAPKEAARTIEEAARALHVAHTTGIVHRDLKPSNLMITPTGGVVVLDFGLARELEGESALTHTGDRFGTPAYMAPEQVDTKLGPSGPRTDVWALGVTLAEAVLGRTPFRGPTDAALYRAILMEEPDLAGLLPTDLRVIVQTALAPQPERRYASTLELARDLEAFRSGRSIAARAPSSFERLSRWAGRNRRVAWTSALAALALVLGTAGTTVGWLRAKERGVELNRAKIEAEATATRTLAINTYLARMLESPNPLRRLGRVRSDVTVAEMLEGASETIATAFPGQPDLEAETRLSIGTTFAGLGRFEDALAHYEISLELFRDLHGDDHPQTVRARRLRATMLGNVGDLELAMAELRDSLAAAVREFGEDHAEVAYANSDLGWALNESERFAEGKQHCEAAVRWFAQSEAHAHELAIAYNNLAVALRSLDDVEGAEAAYGEAIATLTRTYGPDSALVGVATGNLAFLLESAGAHERALQRYAESVDILRSALGEHPILGTTLLGFARALYDRARYAEAEPLCSESVSTLLATLGEADEEYAIAVELHGFLCSYLERHAKAERLFRRSAELLLEHHGDPGRALIARAWAAESLTMGGAADAGLAELEELWLHALSAGDESEPPPQALARAGLRAAEAAGEEALRRRWEARVRG